MDFVIKGVCQNFINILVIAFSLALLAGVAWGCGSAAEAPTSTQYIPVPRAQTLVLGDIDAEEPVKKIERFQPLADYLAAELGIHGMREGRVRIARDIDEMGLFMANGDVDVFFDSTFPSLAVRDIAGSNIILRRWKEGNPEIWSMFVARKDSGLDSVDDLIGKIVAVEEPFSTSGFLLPVAALVQRGLTATQVSSIDGPIGRDEIGYYFSGDEENTVELVLRGTVAAGALSNEDFDALPVEVMDQMTVFGQTARVPRQLVSARADLGDGILDEITALLTGLQETEEGRSLLAGLKNTTKFDAVPADAAGQLLKLKHMMDLLKQR